MLRSLIWNDSILFYTLLSTSIDALIVVLGVNNMKWTSEQVDIISRGTGSTCVIAAPGSGKTSVLIEHIVQVMDRKNILPQSLMAVTFTRQAAMHMRQKLAKHPQLSRRTWESLRIGTFHAQMFHALLQRYPDIPVLLDDREQNKLMRQAIEQTLGQRHHVSEHHVRTTLTQYARDIGTGVVYSVRKPLRRIYSTYQTLKRRAHRWDYEDILVATGHIVEHAESIPYFDSLEYLLVDEFQDTNLLQWNVVLRLHERYKIPVFVVGDDDQSIYAFRGASPRYLQRSCDALRDASLSLLTYNFRSVPIIVHHAEKLICHVSERMKKPLRSVSEANGFISVFAVENDVKEAMFVCGLLHSMLQVNAKLKIGVLARTRRQLYLVWTRFNEVISSDRNERHRVHFRTFHDSKGKEWDAVILLDLISTHMVELEDSQIEWMDEERRLLYVAMTRAKSILIGFVPRRVNQRSIHVSPYIQESGMVLSNWSDQAIDSVRAFIQDLD